MAEQSLEIPADDIESALQKAAETFHVGREYLQAELCGKGRYRVSVLDVPGRIVLALSSDRMRVTIRELHPPLGNGKPVDRSDVQRELELIHVTTGIQESAIQSALDSCLRERKPIRNIDIAVGTEPTVGRDAFIEPHFTIPEDRPSPTSPDLPSYRRLSTAMPGDLCLTKRVWTFGAPGKNVQGGEIPGRFGKDIKLSIGAGITSRTDPETGTIEYIAASYGEIRYSNFRLELLPLVSLHPERTEARLTFVPRSFAGTPLTLEALQSGLEFARVRAGVQEDVITATLAACLKEEKVVEDVIVAKAIPPMLGHESQVEVALSQNRFEAVSNVISGVARAGDLLGRRIPAIAPMDGKLVDGTAIKARSNKEKPYLTPESVERRDVSGIEYLYARLSGLFYIDTDAVEYRPLVRISQDFMTAQIDLYPRKLNSETVTFDDLKFILEESKIRNGILKDALEAQLKEAITQIKFIKQVPAAAGRAEQPGADGRIEKLYTAVGSASEELMAMPGDPLILLHPPKTGLPGVDLFGRELRTHIRPGRAAYIAPGSGISAETQPNGCTLFKATRFGRISDGANVISIDLPLERGKNDMQISGPLALRTVAGTPVKTSAVVDALKFHGVVHGIQEGAIEQFLQGTIRYAENFRFAIGTLPTEAKDGRVEFFFSVNGVSPGSLPTALPNELTELQSLDLIEPKGLIARIHPPANGKPGKTVMGHLIPAASGRPAAIALGDWTQLDKDQISIRSTLETPGYAVFDGHQIRMISPFEISRDKMEVSVTLYAPIPRPDGSPRLLTAEDLAQYVRLSGIKGGVRYDALEAMNRKLERKTHARVTEVLIRGVASKDGVDEQWEVHVGPNPGPLNPSRPSDIRISAEVKQGDILCSVTEALRGTNGFDLFGQIRPARDGRSYGMLVGDRIQVIERPGGKDFIALEDGVMLLHGNRLELINAFILAGDVTVRTGNVNLTDSGVVVTGSVRAGRVVRASGDVIVQESVESARIESLGRVGVNGGIVGKEGFVKSARGIEAQLANGVTLVSAGPIQLAAGCNMSDLTSDDSILITHDNSRVSGGRLRAFHSIDVATVGSELVKTDTLLSVGRLFAKEDAIRSVIAAEKLESEIKSTETALTECQGMIDILTAEENRDRLPDLVARADALLQKLRILKAREEQLLAELRFDPLASICIRQRAYAGTRIQIGSVTHVIEAPMHAVRLFVRDNELMWESVSSVRLSMG